VLADACGSGRAEAGARALETMRFVGEAVIGDVDGFANALGRADVENGDLRSSQG